MANATTPPTLPSEYQQRFTLLMERVGVPLYFGVRGGENSLHMFNTPMNMCKELAHASTSNRQQFASVNATPIVVSNPATTLNLQPIGQACPKNALYSYFNPGHRQAVRQLKEIMIGQPNLQELFNVASACRDNEMINPKVWVSAFTSCLLSRPDTRTFQMPAIWEVLPDEFFSAFAIKEVTRQGGLPRQDRGIIVVDDRRSARNINPENRLAYFREDIGINSHHWHWHLIYTLESNPGQRDRQGELFYYMHHGMIARYDSERLANQLPLTRPLTFNDTVIKDGFFPKLTDTNSSQFWGTRQNETRIQDIHREDDPNMPPGVGTVTLDMIRKYTGRVLEAIDTNMDLARDGRRLPITIDLLGNLVEANRLSVNPQFYGEMGLHNLGHMMIAFAHDPDFRHRENAGVMFDTATAMRDPSFYRWHKYIDDIFDQHKQNLQPYSPTGGEMPLVWQGITVQSIRVQTERQGTPVNEFSTFKMQSHADLSRGTDFTRTSATLGPVFVRFTHLNHDPFTYTITVQNSTNAARSGTVRIFLAPRVNEHGDVFPMTMQRRLFFELDKFTHSLTPGANTITRRSSESTVTIPWEQTFRDLERTMVTPTDSRRNICGCGWPQHMLIPRGTPGGQLYDLVVFITNGEEDRVVQTQTAPTPTPNCRDAVSYCGVLDQLYPDRKPMGYPFDRNPYTITVPGNSVQQPSPNLTDYQSRVPNMSSVQVRIRFNQDRMEVRPDDVPSGLREINGDPATINDRRPVCPDNGMAPSTGTPPARQPQPTPQPRPPQPRPTQSRPAQPMDTSPPRRTSVPVVTTTAGAGGWGRGSSGSGSQSPSPERGRGGWTNQPRTWGGGWGWGG